jgi:hypothetical protein
MDLLEALSKILIGALTESEAARALDLPIDELQRLNRVVNDGSNKLVPISVNLDERRFEFLDLAGVTFQEPFFGETIKEVKKQGKRPLNFQVDLPDFLRAAEAYQAKPGGFIFHVGRCGSTLLANMLSSSGEHLVVKEPELVNELLAGWLRARDEASRHAIEVMLEAAIRYLAGALSEARVAGAARRQILKFAAWNVCLAKILFNLFPSTQGVFIYRSPVETVTSQVFSRPGWFDLIECPRSIQVLFFPSLRDVDESSLLSPVTLFAHAWRSAADAALEADPERLLVIPYEALIGDTETTIVRVLTHFGELIDPSLIAAMVKKREIYSKDSTGLCQFDPLGDHYRPPLSLEQEEEIKAITGDPWCRLSERAARGSSKQGGSKAAARIW